MSIDEAQTQRDDALMGVTPEPEEFSTRCGWCRIEVISFVAPPSMVKVTHQPESPSGFRQSVDRICLECYTELIRLIAARSSLISQT